MARGIFSPISALRILSRSSVMTACLRPRDACPKKASTGPEVIRSSNHGSRRSSSVHAPVCSRSIARGIRTAFLSVANFPIDKVQKSTMQLAFSQLSNSGSGKITTYFRGYSGDELGLRQRLRHSPAQEFSPPASGYPRPWDREREHDLRCVVRRPFRSEKIATSCPQFQSEQGLSEALANLVPLAAITEHTIGRAVNLRSNKGGINVNGNHAQAGSACRSA
ncbi:hypothetical protein PARU111607_16315 [Palleronia rufa]